VLDKRFPNPRELQDHRPDVLQELIVKAEIELAGTSDPAVQRQIEAVIAQLQDEMRRSAS
jgi:hypothetical protein